MVTSEMTPEKTKACLRCFEIKKVSEFYPIGKRYTTSYCKDCTKLSSKEWAETNPDKIRKIRQKAAEKERGTPWGRAGQIREGMVQRSRGKPWPSPEFTRQEIYEIISEGRCAQTGLPFVFGVTKGVQNPWTPVPDRIDSSKGYTKENVQWVVNCYNTAKQSWTDEIVHKMVLACAEQIRLNGNF